MRAFNSETPHPLSTGVTLSAVVLCSSATVPRYYPPRRSYGLRRICLCSVHCSLTERSVRQSTSNLGPIGCQTVARAVQCSAVQCSECRIPDSAVQCSAVQRAPRSGIGPAQLANVRIDRTPTSADEISDGNVGNGGASNGTVPRSSSGTTTNRTAAVGGGGLRNDTKVAVGPGAGSPGKGETTNFRLKRGQTDTAGETAPDAPPLYESVVHDGGEPIVDPLPESPAAPTGPRGPAPPIHLSRRRLGRPGSQAYSPRADRLEQAPTGSRIPSRSRK